MCILCNKIYQPVYLNYFFVTHVENSALKNDSFHARILNFYGTYFINIKYQPTDEGLLIDTLFYDIFKYVGQKITIEFLHIFIMIISLKYLKII